jgi:hypothetical protein
MVPVRMKIVDQARLWFKEGASDKVYEVDLVEVAAGQHVVNFRYGRRGSALRDGTKTPLPVALDKARAVFAALVAEKTRGGYKPMDASAASLPPTPTPTRRPAAADGAKEAKRREWLLAELAKGQRAAEPLRELVRKVGQLALRDAEPLLLELLRSSPPPPGTKPDVWRLLLVRALSRCGTSSAVAPLDAIANDARAPGYLRDAARLALALVDPPRAPELARALLAPLFPQGPSDDAQAMARTIETQLVDAPARARAAAFGLYLVPNHAAARAAVLAVARVARLSGDEFGLLRLLYHAAELTRDRELFALLARRFETLGRVPGNTPTLRFFRRRVARFLRQLGQLGSADYAPLAGALVRAYRSGDAEHVRETEWGSWDAFGRYHALNFVLYARSKRYQRASHRRATWRRRSPRKPAGAPTAREEAFPALWDRAPDELWRVGLSPAALPVIEFATRALRDQTTFLAERSNDDLAAAMTQAHPLMRRLAFDTARPRTPDLVLARGALLAGIAEADDWVLAWVQGDRRAALGNGELVALLATAPSAKVRDTLVTLAEATPLDPAVARLAAAQAIAILIGFGADDAAAARASGAAGVLGRIMGAALDAVDLQVARDLVAHELEPVAALGAELMLRRARTGTLPTGLLDALLASRHAAVRAIGTRIVAETPVELLKDDPDVLVLFSLSANLELREGTRRAIGEVARRYPDVGRAIATRLIDALLVKQEEGVPAHLVSLLRHELVACLPARDAQSILRLTSALSPHARQVGGLLLPQLGPDEVSLEDIVRLGNNEVLLVRRGAWALAEAAGERWKLAPAALGRLCDARWEDSRQFAFGFVRTLPLSPDAILSICDSTQPLVEAFGRQLLQEHWSDDNAGHYLLRLAEHPSANIQLFVSGLLVRHAHGNLELLRQLVPYLLTVLTQVNRGGVAKLRVLEFLRAESVASPEAAALLAPLLERQSLTRAVTHRAPLIATMVALHAEHPAVPLPYTVVPPPAHTHSANATGKGGAGGV